MEGSYEKFCEIGQKLQNCSRSLAMACAVMLRVGAAGVVDQP